MKIEVHKVLGSDCKSRLKLFVDGSDCSYFDRYEKIRLVEQFSRLIGLDCRYGCETLMIDDDFTDDCYIRYVCNFISGQVSLEVNRYEEKKTRKKCAKRQKAFCCNVSNSKKASCNARR